MPKELLPILDKPLIQYAAEEAVAAGIDTLIFVTGRNKRAIEDHFDNNQELEMALRAKGKDSEADMVKNTLPAGVECIFVRQSEQLGLGHAVLCAERAIAGESFAVILADDFLVSTGKGVTAQLVRSHQNNGNSQIAVMKVDGPDISNYGVVVPGKNKDTIIGLIEKPDFKDAPSKLASIGRYVLTPNIFEILRDQKTGKGGEFQLSDAINVLAEVGKVETEKISCKRFDCGSIRGYLSAILSMAKAKGLYKDE
jgi:UTP--glucose-1-phosphate uridylyltransferase